MMNQVTVLLPAYNEEKSISKVISQVRALPIKCDILVIDNKCTDNTATIARELGATVVREERQGKGMAVRTGLAGTNTRYVVMIDADGTARSFRIGVLWSWHHSHTIVDRP